MGFTSFDASLMRSALREPGCAGRCEARAALAASARLAPVCVAICARGGVGATAGARARTTGFGGATTCAAAFARLAPVWVEMCDGGLLAVKRPAVQLSPRL